ncbi:hypothetical protein SHKM778_34340 [Streptomyces sp. KM77-8]|uniref:Transketolase N-terminal domain-containing protein n=1 Tax=Streptomyces haneummycinicus TaxID=3074435 RepID=A0AAT9HI21_9ACTN
MNTGELVELGQQLRVDSVRAAAAAGSGHPTSSMSAADLMAVLFARHLHYDFERPDHPGNDRFVLSKGHASPLMYAVYKAAGAIDDEELLTFRENGSRLEGHPTPRRLPWVETATGSLGQGFPVGVGIAMAGKRLEHAGYRVWVLCGDSELAEGSVWEAAEHGAYEHLDNLTLIVDVNRLGQRGPTRHGHDLDAYARRFQGFGWHTVEVDGHDVDAVDRAYEEAVSTKGRPTVILARTLKGKGVASVQDREGLHGKPLPEADEAIAELGGPRDLRVRVQPLPPTRHRAPDPAGGRSRPAGTRARRWPPATPSARHCPPSAPPAATSWSSTGRSATPRARRPSPRNTPSATSSATSPSSRWSPPPSAWPRAAGHRTPRPSPRSSPAPTTSSAWRRSAAPASPSSARTRGSPSARTAPARWVWRIWR